MQNDPERLHRSNNRVEFSQSLAAIAVLKQQDMAQAKAALVEELLEMVPSAKIKLLQKNNYVSKLTKK
jgi:outer membrane cobalamin receptor